MDPRFPPSDPQVDDLHRGSRPVVHPLGSRTSGNDKDPQKGATKRKKTAEAKPAHQRLRSPARARTTTSRAQNADDNRTRHASSPQRRQMNLPFRG